MYCKKCGKELEDNAAFCRYCGQKQDKENEKETGKEKAAKETGEVSNKKLFLLGAIIAVVILAVIGAVKLVEKSKEDAAVEQSIVKEDVEEKKEEELISENKPESKEEKDKAEAAEEETTEEETKNPEEESQTGDLPESENPLIKYMKVGDSECWFDEDGDLVKMTRMTDGGWSMEIQYMTDEEGNKVCGEQNYLSNSETSIGHSEPFYNDKNYLINSIYYKSDSGTASYEFSYDENNRLITEEWVRKIAEGSEMQQDDGEYLAHKILLEYLENGNKIMISEQTTSASGNDNSTYKEEINLDNGNIASLSWESHNGNQDIEISKEWEYDTNENTIRKSENRTYFLNGAIDYTSYGEYKYDYDENKNVIREESNIDGETDTTVYLYDENGNLLRREIDGKTNKWVFAYQYDEAGRQTKYEQKREGWNYDEEGNMTQQTTSDYNNIYEYDEEGKLISFAYLHSSTKDDVVSYDSWYLYDEQGRLSEIKVDEETAVTISYNEAGLPEKIDSVIEVDYYAIYWQVLYDLLPQDERIQDYIDYENQDIIIEYR